MPYVPWFKKTWCKTSWASCNTPNKTKGKQALLLKYNVPVYSCCAAAIHGKYALHNAFHSYPTSSLPVKTSASESPYCNTSVKLYRLVPKLTPHSFSYFTCWNDWNRLSKFSLISWTRECTAEGACQSRCFCKILPPSSLLHYKQHDESMTRSLGRDARFGSALHGVYHPRAFSCGGAGLLGFVFLLLLVAEQDSRYVEDKSDQLEVGAGVWYHVIY